MRTEEEINLAKQKIESHPELTHGYKEDVTSVLDWILGGDDFDGI